MGAGTAAGRAAVVEAPRVVAVSSQRSVKIAGFVLPIRAGRVLLARHTYGPNGWWAMLGGMVEADETPDVAARREVLEESSLQVTTDRLLAVCDRGDLLMFVFSGRVIGGTERADGDEIAELRWFEPAELGNREDIFELVPRLLTKSSRRGVGLVREGVAWPDGSVHPVYLTAPTD